MDMEPFVPWLICVALLTVRLTIALALSPAITAFGVPASVRVALTVALAGLAYADRNPAPDAAGWAASPSSLIMPVMVEIFIGALLGLAVQVVLAALALAGRLMDVQVGFAIGSLFDPVSGTGSNVLGAMMGLLGATLFMASDAHLQLAGWLAQSIDVFPLGQPVTLNEPLRPLLGTGFLFTLGLTFAAPVVVALLITDLAMGVAARNMPQVNVLLLATPVKVIVAYTVLIFAVRGWGSLLGQGFRRAAEALGVA